MHSAAFTGAHIEHTYIGEGEEHGVRTLESDITYHR